MSVSSVGGNFQTVSLTTGSFISSNANIYLKDLKKKFPECEFAVGNGYINGKKNGVVVDKEYLEKLAKDPKLKKEFEDEVKKLKTSGKFLDERAPVDGVKVLGAGIMFNKDGEMTAYSTTQNLNTGQKRNFFSIVKDPQDKSNLFKSFYNKTIKPKLDMDNALYRIAKEENDARARNNNPDLGTFDFKA